MNVDSRSLRENHLSSQFVITFFAVGDLNPYPIRGGVIFFGPSACAIEFFSEGGGTLNIKSCSPNPFVFGSQVLEIITTSFMEIAKQHLFFPFASH